MLFHIDWASLIVGSKFTVFALFYFVFEGNFPSTSSWGACIWRGDLTEGFLHCCFGGRIFGGAYTLRGVFFTVFIFFLSLPSSLKSLFKLLIRIALDSKCTCSIKTTYKILSNKK